MVTASSVRLFQSIAVLGKNEFLYSAVFTESTRKHCELLLAWVVTRFVVLKSCFHKTVKHHVWCSILTKNIHNIYTDRQTNRERENHHHHQSLNREGRWGTTDDFATSFLHFSLFATALWDLVNSRPVHSLMLSSHLFLCLPYLLPPFTVPCKMVLVRPVEWETWPYHCSLRLFTIVRRSSCGPIACWILAWTSLLVTWSLYEMCGILR